MEYLQFLAKPTAQNGGLFTAARTWIHSTRTIDSFELILVRQGPVYLQENGQQYSLKTGETLLLLPGRTHGGWQESPQGTSFFWLHFLVEKWHLATTPQLGAIATHLALTRWEPLAVLFRQFLHRQQTAGYSRWALNASAEVLLSELEAETQLFALVEDNFWAAKVSSLIRARYTESISTASLAQELGLNPDYLSRIFRQQTGETISAWLRNWRLHIAKGLLSEGKLSIAQVAEKVGIEDPRYFSRLFKKQEGISPSQYRLLFYRTHENSN
jgi:AraC-like DNA-binding protein